MTDDTIILSFDPGASTGFAVLNQDGEILFTATLSIQELPGFLRFIEQIVERNYPLVVIEQGPEFSHHSPVTRRAEETILEIFPSAHRVPPTRWKSHPAYSKRVHIPRRLVTAHENDAVRLAQWFRETGEKSNDHSTKSVGSDDTSTRRKRK